MKQKVVLSIALIGAALAVTAVYNVSAQDNIVAKAKAFVKDAASKANKWTGPTSGPKAAAGKSIIYVSSDQRKGGAQGVGDGVREAAKSVGWDFKLLDGRGTVGTAMHWVKPSCKNLTPSFLVVLTPPNKPIWSNKPTRQVLWSRVGTRQAHQDRKPTRPYSPT